MEVFIHHIYEYEKGLRNLILHTTSATNREKIEEKLNLKEIPYIIQEIERNMINIFFGNENCINVLNAIGKKSLTEYSAEEDFMLGTMLGYDRVRQCQRYMKIKKAKLKVEMLAG